MNSDEPAIRGDRAVYLTSMLWAVPLAFVLTIIATVTALLIAQIGDPEFTALSAVFSGIFFGALIFIPTCFISVPIIGLAIASVRLLLAARRNRAAEDERYG